MFRALTGAVCAVVLTACASPAQFDNIMNAVSDPIVLKTEAFDGSTSVLMRDRALPVIGGGDGTMAYALSASWNSTQPHLVRLQFLASFEARSDGAAYSSPFAKQWEPANAILEVQILADGKRSAWKPKGFDPASAANPAAMTEAMADTGIITVPLAELKQLMAAKDLRMRVKTVGAVLDRDIDFSVKHELLGKELASAVLPRYVAKLDEMAGRTGTPAGKPAAAAQGGDASPRAPHRGGHARAAEPGLRQPAQ